MKPRALHSHLISINRIVSGAAADTSHDRLNQDGKSLATLGCITSINVNTDNAIASSPSLVTPAWVNMIIYNAAPLTWNLIESCMVEPTALIPGLRNLTIVFYLDIHLEGGSKSDMCIVYSVEPQ